MGKCVCFKWGKVKVFGVNGSICNFFKDFGV